jgi:two-component system, OmpR family, alkaline phosphatase synthesis response regulator PhoP
MAEIKKLLIVEDEPLLGNLLKQRFEKEGIEVILARDGEEALNILRSTKPDLILLDIILPKISGFELLETMSADPNVEKAPVIITSNLGQDSDVKKGQSLGAIEYFVKAKISIEELVGHVKSVLESGTQNSV